MFVFHSYFDKKQITMNCNYDTILSQSVLLVCEYKNMKDFDLKQFSVDDLYTERWLFFVCINNILFIFIFYKNETIKMSL
jgi:hypothetical protein